MRASISSARGQLTRLDPDPVHSMAKKSTPASFAQLELNQDGGRESGTARGERVTSWLRSTEMDGRRAHRSGVGGALATMAALFDDDSKDVCSLAQ